MLTQIEEFSTEDRAPEAWVATVEATMIGPCKWLDTSWHNDVSPSWQLTDKASDRAYYVAYYTTVANTDDGRDEKRADYVTVCELVGERETTEVSIEVTPKQFLAALTASSPEDFYARLKREKATDDLCNELNGYCDRQGLPHLSADEILLERGLTPAQRVWLLNFVSRWDTLVESARMPAPPSVLVTLTADQAKELESVLWELASEVEDGVRTLREDRPLSAVWRAVADARRP